MGEEEENLPVVLIVDDNSQTIDLLKRFFHKANERNDLSCRVIEANHGAKGIELVLQENPDLILCEIRMPGKDGFEVLADFNNICKEQIPYCFFAFLSAAPEERSHAFKAGTMGFISKTEMNYYTFTLQIRAWLRLASLERQEEIRQLENTVGNGDD